MHSTLHSMHTLRHSRACRLDVLLELIRLENLFTVLERRESRARKGQNWTLTLELLSLHRLTGLVPGIISHLDQLACL